jgi:hypothetical protein
VLVFAFSVLFAITKTKFEEVCLQICREVAIVPHIQLRAAGDIPSFKLRDEIEQAASLLMKTRNLFRVLEGCFDHEN